MEHCFLVRLTLKNDVKCATVIKNRFGMMYKNNIIRATVAKQTMQHVCGVFKKFITVVKNKLFMNIKISKMQNCHQK